MSDLFAPPVAPDLLNSPRLRIMQVDGDNMEPTLRSRFDYVLVAPVDSYHHEGIYVLDADPFPGMLLYRCTSDFAGGVRLLNDNKVYRQDHRVPREWFAQHVLGKVVALIKVQDHHLLNGEPYPTMQPVRGTGL